MTQSQRGGILSTECMGKVFVAAQAVKDPLPSTAGLSHRWVAQCFCIRL